jgi:general secretion pathway protein D
VHWISWQSQFSLLLLAVVLLGCQTTDNDFTNYRVWQPGPSIINDANPIAVATSHTSVLTSAVAKGEQENASFIFGTGRFLGDPPSDTKQISKDDDDGVTLNLVNVSIPDAAKTILSDVLSVKYTIDPAIAGKVTIQTPKPVSKSTVIDLFQSALRTNNATIVNVGGHFKIVTADQATIGAPIQLDESPDSAETLGTRLQIVELKYVAASEMRRILEPISPRGGIVRVDDTRNSLTLSGNSQEIANMMDAIYVFDVDVMKGMSFALIPVKTSQPDSIADQLKSIFSSDQEGPMAGMVRFIPNKQLNAVLVISPQREYLSRAGAWVRRLDARGAGSEKQFFTYAVQNRTARELADVLQLIFSSEIGARTGSASRNVSPQYKEARIQSSAPAQPSFQSVNTTSPLSASDNMAIQSQNAINSYGAEKNRPPSTPSINPGLITQAVNTNNDQEPAIKIVVDEGKNAILIEASPANYRRVLRALQKLDVVPKQVLIEATIAEISLNDELKFGLRWFLNHGGSSFTFSDAVSGAVGSVFPGFSYALNLTNVTATLNALNDITNVNVISSPSLTVMDNKTAVLQIGDQVPITTQSAISTSVPNAPIVNSISYKDTGVILSITPRINDSGKILLDLEQEVSTVAATTTSGIDSPTIRQRRIKTSVVVKDGEALALGGMIQDSKTVARTQIPILGDIPLVGNAFKHKDNQVNKTELIIVLTPHLMRDFNEARRVTEEYRQELATYAPSPLRDGRTIDQAARRTFE